MFRVCLIGLGKRGQIFLSSLLGMSDVSLVAVCDPNQEAIDGIRLPRDVHVFNDHRVLVDRLCLQVDAAVVCVPHDFHFSVTEHLLQNGINVLKEKPLALSQEEGRCLIDLANSRELSLLVAMQRRYMPLYSFVKLAIDQLGALYRVEGHYALKVKRLDEGWRAGKSADVLVDMGYHIIDLIVWYFGLPKSVFGRLTKNKYGKVYQANDTAFFTFFRDQLIADFTITRDGLQKDERLLVMGENGALQVIKNTLFVYDRAKNMVAKYDSEYDEIDIVQNMVGDFIRSVAGKKTGQVDGHHLDHLRFISAVNESNITGEKCEIYSQGEIDKKDYVWPIITPDIKRAVLNQLYETVSIYDRSGVIKRFEDSFGGYHSAKHALLSNSGTSAIYSMFEGIGVQKGDAVIASVYTFPATVSPARYMGAQIIFCDCDRNGNISPVDLRKKLSEHKDVKAVIITHMWGVPCEMGEIVSICKLHNLPLLEDCSHAHGARYHGRLVGTFGAAAAWSLQGSKIITGGEGGIMLTNDSEIYYRALLQGHYNKRCLREIPPDHHLSKFSRTGFGLKLRSHPIAVAIAYEHFRKIDEILQQKRSYALLIIQALSSIPFLAMPNTDSHVLPSWYALVMQFKPEMVSFSLDDFCDKLKLEGLSEVDRPGSTRTLYELPLFSESTQVAVSTNRSAMFSKSVTKGKGLFPVADSFFANAIKIPVWSLPNDKPTVERYIRTFLRVSDTMFNESCAINHEVLRPKL